MSTPFRPVLALVLATAACGPQTVSTPSTDGSTGSSSSSEPFPETGSTSPLPDPATSGPPVPDPDGTGSTGSLDPDSAGFITPPDGGGGVAPGRCLGIRAVGHLATVHRETPVATPSVCTPDPTNCGSDPVGSWSIESHCGFEDLPNFFAGTCPESTMVVLDSEVDGTRTFSADDGYAEDFELSVELSLDIDPQSCFGSSCTDFGELLDQDPSLVASCSDAEGSCRCDLTLVDSATRTGTYAVTEQGVVITTVDGPGEPIPFCRESDTLTMWDPLVESRLRDEVPCESDADCEEELSGDFDWSCVN